MTSPIETGTILDRILARTSSDLVVRREREPYSALERRAMDTPVQASLRQAIARPGTSVIAEFKRASPSRGRFAVEMNPVDVAAEYAADHGIFDKYTDREKQAFYELLVIYGAVTYHLYEKALKEKKKSSIAIGFHLLATGKTDAFISE